MNVLFEKKILKRKLIDGKEYNITYVQLIGFLLILLGVLYYLYKLIYPIHWGNLPLNGEKAALAYFIIMLGISLAFPSLLREKSEGLSTMRIVVFMMVNVICMLLLKIGWDAKNLGDIKLDEYWLGVIAFVFGAKATQSYFESKLATMRSLNSNANEIPINNFSNIEIAPPKIIEEAIINKGKEWVESFPNVTGLSVMNKIRNGMELKNSSLVFKVIEKIDNLSYGQIPTYFDFKSKDGKLYRILTDVIIEQIPTPNLASIAHDEPPFPLGNSVSREFDRNTGSVGLILNKIGNPNTNYLISCYHVLCAPELKYNNKTFIGENAKIRCASVEDEGTNIIGEVIEGEMDISSDFAISKLYSNVKFENRIYDWNIVPSDFAWVLPEDKGKWIKMSGRTSGKKQGKIKSHYSSQNIYYNDRKIVQYYSGLIEIDKISEGGDSGAAVVNEDNKIIGLIVASSPNSSYVLPVMNFILNGNYELKQQ